MSSFSTGDPIEIKLPSGNWSPRVFLAEHNGRVFYKADAYSTDSSSIDASKVRAPLPPAPPFQVGDRIRRTGHEYDRHVIHVDARRVVVAHYDTLVGCAYTKEFPTSSTRGWRLVAPQVWTSPAGNTYNLSSAYRDRDGDTWRFTGHTSPEGEPQVVCSADPLERAFGPAAGRNVEYVRRMYGPLQEVSA